MSDNNVLNSIENRLFETRELNQICGFILAGGISSRLGLDKCLLEIDDKKIIDIIVEKLSSILNRVIIVAKDPGKFREYEVWIDEYPLRCAISGLYTILSLSTFNWNFIIGCDMPFINRNLIKYIISVALSYDYREVDVIVPVVNGYFEPLFAIYSKNVYSKLHEFIENGGRSLQRFIEKTRLKKIYERDIRLYDPDLLSFFNINTPIDLIAMKRYKNIV